MSNDICKGYKQAIKFAASKERVYRVVQLHTLKATISYANSLQVRIYTLEKTDPTEIERTLEN